MDFSFQKKNSFLFLNVVLVYTIIFCSSGYLKSTELTTSRIENYFSYEVSSRYGGRTFIRYKNMAHLFIPTSNSEVLLVAFHGGIPNVQKPSMLVPIFRLYNLKVTNQPHVLCFSDLLLDLYKNQEMRLAWYADTQKIKQRDIIEEVVKYYVDKYSIKHIVFHGSSGGGHVALEMASRFNQVALISNCQFNLSTHPHFTTLVKNLSSNCDKLENFEIESLLKSKKGPSRCISYCNIADTTTLPEHNYLDCVLNDLFPGILEAYYFDGSQIAFERNIPNHGVFFPNGEKVENILEEYFLDLNR